MRNITGKICREH